MDKKIRFEIDTSGTIHAKTIGMNDEKCLEYIEIIEKLLDAQTIDSEFTEEYLHAQAGRIVQDEHIQEQTEIKGE